jgi:hypothetical protein
LLLNTSKGRKPPTTAKRGRDEPRRTEPRLLKMADPFGNPAIFDLSQRPEALRPRLTTGLPFDCRNTRASSAGFDVCSRQAEIRANNQALALPTGRFCDARDTAMQPRKESYRCGGSAPECCWANVLTLESG